MEELKHTSGGSQRESVVDTLFDTLTERTVKALVFAAGWLEKQAKVVRDLAGKLEKRTDPTAPAAPAA